MLLSYCLAPSIEKQKTTHARDESFPDSGSVSASQQSFPYLRLPPFLDAFQASSNDQLGSAASASVVTTIPHALSGSSLSEAKWSYMSLPLIGFGPNETEVLATAGSATAPEAAGHSKRYKKPDRMAPPHKSTMQQVKQLAPPSCDVIPRQESKPRPEAVNSTMWAVSEHFEALTSYDYGAHFESVVAGALPGTNTLFEGLLDHKKVSVDSTELGGGTSDPTPSDAGSVNVNDAASDVIRELLAEDD